MGAIWDADFTTRMGAETATGMGGLASFVFAGLCVLGAVFVGGAMGYDTPDGMVFVAVAGIEALIAVIAGFRLRAGKGAVWGCAIVLLMVLELIVKLFSLAIGVGLIFNALLLWLVLQGVRGAFALRKSEFGEDDIEAFE